MITWILLSPDNVKSDNDFVLVKPPGLEKAINIKHIDTELMEAAIRYYTNIQRQRYGLKELVPHKKLTECARGHSGEMALLTTFGHISPNPYSRRLTDRLKNAGIDLPGNKYGENIAVDYILHLAGIPYIKRWKDGKIHYYYSHGEREVLPQSYDRFAKAMVNNWMLSPGHKANLLEKTFTHIGIGVAKGKHEKIDALYVTQNFLGRTSAVEEIISNNNPALNKF